MFESTDTPAVELIVPVPAFDAKHNQLIVKKLFYRLVQQEGTSLYYIAISSRFL